MDNLIQDLRNGEILYSVVNDETVRNFVPPTKLAITAANTLAKCKEVINQLGVANQQLQNKLQQYIAHDEMLQKELNKCTQSESVLKSEIKSLRGKLESVIQSTMSWPSSK